MPKIVTHNLPGWLSAADRTATVKQLCDMSGDLVCLQESPWLDAADVPAGWRILRGDSQTALTILAADRFTVTGWADRRAYPETTVGSWGAGPSTLKAGWDIGVRLQRASDGYEWWTFNAHLAPSADQAAPTDPAALDSWTKRRELHGLEIDQLCAMTDGLPGHVMVVGDFNADPDSDLMAAMRARFTYMSGATFQDGRRLDHIWQRGGTPIEGPTLVDTPSDHHALYGRWQIDAPA